MCILLDYIHIPNNMFAEKSSFKERYVIVRGYSLEVKSGAPDIANSGKVQNTFIPFNKSSEK